MGLVIGLIAAGLFGNIGIKTIYINLFEELFKGPPLMSSKGTMFEFNAFLMHIINTRVLVLVYRFVFSIRMNASLSFESSFRNRLRYTAAC
ncbi:hypothetical protein M378DRAFT_163928 [Amanita muscaria Koide BX008]|uniref:Uncharacterized protein n=1 Tax=Amanita muscaria (strain Koide BX008) TaxID=946122 RepID=A0A0C2WQL0_AMAMK|nr:hypothetical protein M378DRAFT_163928 [Amanita muscaria Koide BX008]